MKEGPYRVTTLHVPRTRQNLMHRTQRVVIAASSLCLLEQDRYPTVIVAGNRTKLPPVFWPMGRASVEGARCWGTPVEAAAYLHIAN